MAEADPFSLAWRLSKAQRRLVLASEPGGWGRADTATGAEIKGAGYSTARSLAKLGIGTYSDGSPYGDLYFNTALGLEVRAYLGSPRDD